MNYLRAGALTLVAGAVLAVIALPVNSQATRVFGYVVVPETVEAQQVQARMYPVMAFEGGRYIPARIWGPEQQVRNLRSSSVLNKVKKFDLFASGRPHGVFAIHNLEIPAHPCWTELYGAGKATLSQPLDFSRGTRDVPDMAGVRVLHLAAASGLTARDFWTLQPYGPTAEERRQLIGVAQEHFDRFRKEMALKQVADVKSRSAPTLDLIQSVDVERDGALEIIAHVEFPIVPVGIGDFEWNAVYVRIIARSNAIARPLAVLPPSNIPYRQVQAIDLRGSGSADLLFHSDQHLMYGIYSLQGGKFIPVLEEGLRYYC